VLAASQVAFATYHEVYPDLWLPLRLYRPSDVLHGAVGPTMWAQFTLSVAVGLLCFGLLALVPLPPLDGYRLIPSAACRRLSAVERYGVVVVLLLLIVPIAGRPPLQVALDLVAGPLVRAWS
jgi:Zn-dependent protease